MRKIGRYVLLSRIASGTLGDVFLARRAARESSSEAVTEEVHFAVKLLRPELARDLRFVRLLFAEAPAAMRFEHPSAVRVLEVDRDGAEVFIAMELAHGQPLSSVLKRAQIAGEPLDHRLVCWIGAEVASVLHRAHETPWFASAPVGMVHGGISPRSVLLTYDGRIKLLGVGLGRARLATPASSARLAYQAPELIADREPTPRTDTYALGVLLYDALSGKHVFRRATDEETRAAIKEARVPPLNPLSLRVSPEIGELIQRMIVPKIEARFADLEAIEGALRDAAAGAGNAGEELSIALERRMRAIFAGEMRAERRVVLAAQRQPRVATPTPPTPIPSPFPSPIPAAAMSALPNAANGSGLAPIAASEAPVPASSTSTPGEAEGDWSGPISIPSLPLQPIDDPSAGEDTERAMRLSDADLRRLANPLPPSPSPEEAGVPPAPQSSVPDAPQPSRTDPEVHAPSSSHASAHDAAQASAHGSTPALGRFSQLLENAVEELAVRGSVPTLPAVDDGDPLRTLDSTAPGSTLPTAEVERLPADAESVRPSAETTTVDVGVKRRVARYQTEAVLSRSACTVMFRARDPNIGRNVALKVMDPDFVSDPRLRREEWIALFKREARIAGRLTHPRLPPLYDAGRDSNVYFIVYGLIEGEPLNAVFDRGQPLRVDQIRRILADVADALDHLHRRGVVHCDVRGANVILGRDGSAYLVDFSMAIEAGAPEHPLLASNLLALSPEYLAGFGYSERADQFALGTLLYQMLTGIRPFRGSDDRELIRAIEEKSPRPPESIDPRVDPELSEIAMRLLEKDREMRFESAGAVARRAEELIRRASPEPAETPRPPPERAPKSGDLERDTQPSLRPMRSPLGKEGADIVIADAELDPALAEKALAAHGEKALIYADLEEAMHAIGAERPRAVVVSRSTAGDARTVRRRVADVSRDIELRIVPELASRLVGPAIATEELATALAEMYERAGTLVQRIEYGADRGPVGAARVLAKKLGAGPRAELLAPLAVAARDLAARLRLSPTSEAIASIVPHEVSMLFTEIEVVLVEPAGARGPSASLLAQIVFLVECYFAATSPKDGRQRVSPRRAVLALRDQSAGRVRPEVIDALIDHLRETISALDLGPGEASDSEEGASS